MNIQGDQLAPGNHNITILLHNTEPIVACTNSFDITNITWNNSTEPKQIMFDSWITTARAEFQFDIHAENVYNPINITFEPEDIDHFPIDGQGYVSFDIRLQLSEFIPKIWVEVYPHPKGSFLEADLSTDIDSDLYRKDDCLDITLQNVTEGEHSLHLKVRLIGPNAVGFEALARINLVNQSTITYDLLIDSNPLESTPNLNVEYYLNPVSTLFAIEPWILGTTGRTTYAYNFTVDRQFSFRLADDYREHLAFFAAQHSLQTINIQKETDLRYPNTYRLNFYYTEPTQITLGFSVAEYTWFLRPSIILNHTIPSIVWTEVYNTFDERMDISSSYV